MIRILAIETTGPHCSAALIDETGKVTEKVSDGTLNHLQNLIPMIGELLTDRALQIDDLTAIAVSRGPGSFTGIRIGVTTARALCQAAELPGMAISSLKSFAYLHTDDGGIVAPMFDARRSQVYAGAYRWIRADEGAETCAAEGVPSVRRLEEIVPGGAYMLDEFLQLLAERAARHLEIRFMGDGCRPYGEAAVGFCTERGMDAALSCETQRAAAVAKLALATYREEGAAALLPYGQIQPDYMRKSEAERKLEERKRLEAEQAVCDTQKGAAEK